MILNDFTNDDSENLYAFMQPLWLETYGDFLPNEQILFLLAKYFSPTGLQKYREKGYLYKKIDNVGVLVFIERETDVYIDKLYLLQSARGKGYAKFVFDELLKIGKPLSLNVNQNNARAVACYLKNGFTIVEQTDITLENGMINRDYVMQKKK